MDPVYILITAEWQTATKQTSNYVQCWQKPAARHMKVASFIAGQAPKDCGRPNSNEGCPGLVSSRPSFHPIHCAASQGMVPAARVMLNQSCGHQAGSGQERLCDLLDGSGRSPLHWAAIMGQTDVMSLLLEHGASLDSRDPAGRTPLFSCAAFGSVAAVRLLLQRGADQNAQDDRGLTPLHAAASGGHLEAASALLFSDADPRCRAAVGATPRHIAERHGHAEMAALLAVAERQAAAGRVGGCGVDASPRETHAKESFLTQLRRDQRAALMQSA